MAPHAAGLQSHHSYCKASFIHSPYQSYDAVMTGVVRYVHMLPPKIMHGPHAYCLAQYLQQCVLQFDISIGYTLSMTVVYSQYKLLEEPPAGSAPCIRWVVAPALAEQYSATVAYLARGSLSLFRDCT